MLKNLSLKFNVVGKGTEVLKKIKSSYDETEKLLKEPLKIKLGNIVKNPFKKVGVFSSDLINKTSQISKAFKKRFNEIQKIGVKTFQSLGKSVDKFINKFKVTRGLKKGFQTFSKYSTKVFNQANKEAGKLRGTISRVVGALGAGFTIKTAFEGASSMEQYRNTMETILKDPRQAQQKLAWSSRFANKTPFETGEVVEAMTRLQSYGMEGDRLLKTTNRTYMEMIGDMASAMNKPLEQAVEALADSRTGELERLKEFGITKNMIGDFAKLKGYGELFNNKGQIKDLNMFNRALFELMDSKFGGAMEKQARTFKGAMSTIKGVFKSGLSTLAGIDEFGNVIENSPFQILRDKVLIPLADKLVKWQSDGTFTKWAEKLAESLQKSINVGSKFIKFCVEWKEVLIPLASALTGLFVINKVAYAVGALKVALAGLSFNPIVAGIGLAIAGGVALYRNWDKVKEGFKKVSQVFLSVMGSVKKGITSVISGLKNFYEGFINIIKEIKEKIFNFFNSLSKYTGIFNFLIPGKLIFEGLKSFWNAWDSNLGIIDNIKNGFSAFFSSIKKGIQSAIGSFIKVYEVIDNTVKGIKEKISNLFDSLSEYTGIFNFLIPGKLIFKGLKSFWNAWDSNLGVIDNVKNSFSAFFLSIKDGIQSAIDGFKNLGKKISELSPVKKVKKWFDFNDEDELKDKTTTEIKKVKIESEKEKIEEVDGSHRNGLSYVPRDNYVARLHEGERVLTKGENKEYSKGKESKKTYILNLTVNNNGKEINFNQLGNFIIKKIKEFEEEKEIAEGLI